MFICINYKTSHNNYYYHSMIAIKSHVAFVIT